jgi:hypothetical protein
VKAERGREDANGGNSAGLNPFARLNTTVHAKQVVMSARESEGVAGRRCVAYVAPPACSSRPCDPGV